MARHSLVQALLDDIETFRVETHLNPTRFGQLAVGDGNFIRAVKLGRTPSLSTIEKVRKFMKAYKRRAA